MGLETPAALALGLLAGAILLLHLLRPRRRQRELPSTLIWRALAREGADGASPAGWRLPGGLLLWLQLAALTALVLALAGPWRRAPLAIAPNLLLLIDRSMSMAATDRAPSRLAAAAEAALDRAEAAPGSSLTLIAFDRSAELLLSGAGDPADLRAALAGLEPRLLPGDAGEALRLAAALAGSDPSTRVVLFSDGNFTLTGDLSGLPPVELVPIGRSDDNQTLAALELGAGATGSELFVRVVNSAGRPRERRVEVRVDGKLVDVRALDLPPNGQRSFQLALEPGAETVEARLDGRDALPQDDVAWALGGGPPPLRVALVSPGNRFLETALDLLPEVETWRRFDAEAQPAGSLALATDGGPADVVILDGFVPATLPASPLIVIAPPTDLGQGRESVRSLGRLEQPAPRPIDPRHPLLAGIAFETVAIEQALALELGLAWTPLALARVEGRDWPLMAEGQLAGRPALLLAFDPRASDMPLRPALPLWLAAALSRLAPGGTEAPALRLDPGDPLRLPAPDEAPVPRLVGPDGQVRTASIAAGQAVFADTELPGIYRIERPGVAEPSTARFVVSLADGRAHPIRARGLPPALVAANAAGPAGSGSALSIPGSSERGDGDAANATDPDAPPAPELGRRRLWPWLAWLALALLLLEWGWDHRSTLARERAARAWRFLGARGPSAGRGRHRDRAA